MNAPIRFFFSSPYRWRSLMAFNANAFPSDVDSLVASCCSRLALFFLHTGTISAAVARDTAEFREELERHRATFEDGVRQRPEQIYLLVYDGIAYKAELHSALNAMKSFLDVYATLLGKLINRKNAWSFNKAKIEGVELSGGRFVQAIRSASRTGAYSRLADLTLDNSRRWITQAVIYRDQLSHRSDLDNMVPMHIVLGPQAPTVRSEQVVTPVMPNGIQVAAYLEGLRGELCSFVDASLRLAPDVNVNALSRIES